MYANDTLKICEAENTDNLIKQCTDGLLKVSNWCKANKLTMNCNKTKCMVIKYKKNTDVSKLQIRGKEIGLVNSCEYLGIELDEYSLFNRYVDNIRREKKTQTNWDII